MAQVTFTISSENLPYFIDYYGREYDLLVSGGEIDGEAVTKSAYAKEEAFKHLAAPVRKWHKQKAAKEVVEIDITK